MQGFLLCILISVNTGKGLVEGKIKVHLAKPAHESMMVVKFLGTFTGLRNAERMHHYFQKNKRGRADVEKIVSKSEKTRCGSGAKLQNQEELILYGYIGISEDLVKLDLNMTSSISVESRRKIEEFANAPVRAK